MLTQLSTVKSRLAVMVTDYDDLLTNAIKAVSARFDKETNRALARNTTATHEFDATDTEILLPCYPVESVTKFELKSNETDGWSEQSAGELRVERDGQRNGTLVADQILHTGHSHCRRNRPPRRRRTSRRRTSRLLVPQPRKYWLGPLLAPRRHIPSLPPVRSSLRSPRGIEKIRKIPAVTTLVLSGSCGLDLLWLLDGWRLELS